MLKDVVVDVVPDSTDPLFVPPSSFVLGDPSTYKSISTDASFSGDITVCLSYLPSAFPLGTRPRLYNFVDEVWVDVTTRVDPARRSSAASLPPLAPSPSAPSDLR
ncbi:hypothetical protein NSK_005679 [Nannochloropsis salina CCMP1776]|uniref:Uncharacterized protein n=1 Tax=Nannochloropsis salina CCMP1776 TaxID=1027361 RepID=A0A4D9CUU3_9STRA|nr:hypothetical protein NSK_005679 [Nannochloropsis salina CCMP1776]|eukprot:TFJ82990.1 hypothetical protein NSK_005679 [Nannochloropsis salina CCMP1776]